MKKFLALILAALMCLTVFVACTPAAPADNASDANLAPENNDAAPASDWEYIKANGKLVVGMTLFAPMNYYDDDNNFVGFETEFAKAVGEKLGIDVEFVEIDWTTKEIELAAKSIDCIWNGMTITPERAEAMSISTPYMANKQVLVAKAENAESYSTPGNLTDKIVVAEAESAGEGVATGDNYFASANYVAVDTMAKALLEVSSGTADACVVDYVAAIGMIGEGTDYADLTTVDTDNFSPEEYGVAFRKGSDVTEKANAAMKALAEDGTLKAIAEKYKLDELLLF